MSPLLKKILLILALLTISALIGFGLYYFFKTTGLVQLPGGPVPTALKQFPPAGERPTELPGGVAAPGELPLAAEREGAAAPPIPPSYYTPEAVSKISSDYAVLPSVSADGTTRYYNATDGKFYRVSTDGIVTAMSDQVFYNVNDVTWAKNKDKAVLEYPDSSKIIYDFKAQTQVSLPKHWENFSFSPDSSELAAESLGLSPENRWLVTTQDNGVGTKLIEPLGDNADKVTVDWSPSRQTVALSRTGQPQGLDRQEVLFIGLNGENFKSTVVEGLDFMPQWSPTGKKLLYSVDSERSDFKPELWVVNSYGDDIGSGRQSLKLNTWADKCSFASDDTLFCAVPQTLPAGAGMAPNIADNTNDDLYKIDLTTGLKTPVPLGGNYHIDNISFDSTHNKIIFTDPHQTGVFQVNL